MSMSEEPEQTLNSRISSVIERIEQLVADGYTEAVSAIRPLAELPATIHAIGDSIDIGAGIALQAVEVLLDVLEANKEPPVFNERPLGPGGEQLARELAADLMELQYDDQHQSFDYDTVRDLQTKARCLLTGESPDLMLRDKQLNS